jgi:hypothetical protein
MRERRGCYRAQANLPLVAPGCKGAVQRPRNFWTTDEAIGRQFETAGVPAAPARPSATAFAKARSTPERISMDAGSIWPRRVDVVLHRGLRLPPAPAGTHPGHDPQGAAHELRRCLLGGEADDPRRAGRRVDAEPDLHAHRVQTRPEGAGDRGSPERGRGSAPPPTGRTRDCRTRRASAPHPAAPRGRASPPPVPYRPRKEPNLAASAAPAAGSVSGGSKVRRSRSAPGSAAPHRRATASASALPNSASSTPPSADRTDTG